MELHPIDTFFEVSNEPVAGGDDGVNLRHGHMAHRLQSCQVSANWCSELISAEVAPTFFIISTMHKCKSLDT